MVLRISVSSGFVYHSFRFIVNESLNLSLCAIMCVYSNLADF